MTFKSLLILPLLVVSLQAADVDDLTFVLNEAGTEYSLTDCNESATDSLEIPSVYYGLPVTSIGDSAFYRCTGLTSITIPDSVTSIEGYAFYTSSLTSIIIPDSVISIGDYVFYRSPNLASVTIGNGVTSIGVYAFYDCTSLSSITIGESVASIGERAFRNCTSLSSITIPDSVTEIRDYLFYGCSDLASVTIGNGVTSIGSYAFSDCTTLTSITIPDSVTSIVFSAFEGCSNLTSLFFTSPLLVAAETARDTAESQRDIAETERDARPTQAAYDAVVAERNARLTESEVRDLRLGSSMLEVVDGDASINIELEATDNLGITSPTWTPVPESKVVINPNFQSGKIKIDVKADDAYNSGVRFFRFKMNDSDSSNKDFNLSIGESEYDEAAIIQALADQYGVPTSSISLSVTGG